VSMILVSHDLGAIEQLCDRVVLLNQGAVLCSGPSADVVTAYQRLAAGAAPAAVSSASAPEPDDPDSILRILALTIRTPEGRDILTVRAGDPIVASIALEASAALEGVQVSLSIYDFERGTLLVECTNRDGAPLALAPGRTSFEFVIPQLLLARGRYTLGVTARPASAPDATAWRFGRTTLYVHGGSERTGVFLLPYQCGVVSSREASLRR